MITSFFNKSKPNNYIIIFLLALIGFVIAITKYNTLPLNLYNGLKLTLNFGLTYLSIFVINFIVKRNDLTKDNTYAVLAYVIGLLLFPQTFLNVKIIVSNLFIILALRRLLSLSSQKNTIKKLLDFGVLIAIATLFNKWALTGFVLVFIALVYNPEKRFNYWLLPFVGFLSISILSYVVYLYMPNLLSYIDVVFYYKWLTFKTYNWKFNFALVVFLILTLISLLYYLQGIKNKKRIKQPAFYLVVFSWVVFCFITLIQPTKTSSEVLFLFMPSSIIIANSLQGNSIKIVNDIILGICFISVIIITFI